MKTSPNPTAATALSPALSRKERRTRRRTALTREGMAIPGDLRAGLLCALINDINLLLILGGMLACPLLLSHHLAKRTLGGLVVQRRLPRAVCAGDLLVVHVAHRQHAAAVGGMDSGPGGHRPLLDQREWRASETALSGNRACCFPTSQRGKLLAAIIAAGSRSAGRYSLGPMQDFDPLSLWPVPLFIHRAARRPR